MPRRNSIIERANTPIIILLLFLSGISGLTYEVIWLRQLHLIFGVTAFALATMLAAFMAGLALGSYLFGRLADRVSSPLLVYALLELGIGVYALLSPHLFAGLDNLYIAFGRHLGHQHLLLDLLRTVGAFLIILLPTSFMGGTLPMISKTAVRHEGEMGLKIGLLYGINTLGATLGAFLAGFFLIRLLGMQHTTWLAAAVNLLVALMAGGLALVLPPPAVAFAPAAPPEQAPGQAPTPSLRPWVLLAFALSGFASLAYEVLWTRSLVYFLGLSTYAFTTMLTAFLIGIAAGSIIAARFIDRLRQRLLAFAVVEILIAFFALALMPTINLMVPASLSLGEIFGREAWWSVVGVRFTVALILMLPATLAMGATLPLVVRYYSDHLAILGRGLGAVYAVNTLGAILGSLAAGFVLIPLFGVRLSISLIVMVNLLAAAIIIFKLPALPRQTRRMLRGASAIILVGAIVLADRQPLVLSSVEFKGLQKRYDLLFVKESTDASLAVLQDKVNGSRELSIDGESTAFTIYQDMQVHKLLGHLAPLFHPDPKDFLVVGFGFGSTAYASTLYPGAQVDCVELVKDEVQTAPFFEAQNHGVLTYPNLNLLIGDGRDYIKLTQKTYDVISFNAIHPKISPNLYTTDFYRHCRRLLNDDGMIVAWMPPNAMTSGEFWSLVKSFQTVFPYSSLWYVNPSHMLILGALQPYTIDWPRLTARLSDPRINADLAETNLADPCEILSNFVAADGHLANLTRDATLNTDNHPLVEFSQEHRVTVNVDAIRDMQRGKQSAFNYLTGFDSDAARNAVRDSLAVYEDLKAWVVEGQVHAWLGLYDQARDYYNRALAIQPNNANTRYLLGLIDRMKDDLLKLVALNPANLRAHKALGDIYVEENEPDLAQRHFLTAIRLDEGYAEAHHALGVTYYQQGRPTQALQSFARATRLDPSLSAAWFYAGLAYWRMGDANQALNHFQQAVDTDPIRPDNYYWLALALDKQGRRAQAVAALRQALQIDPDFTPARQALEGLLPNN